MLIRPATTPSCTLCQTAGTCVPWQGKRTTRPRLAALERKLSGERLFKAVESYNVPEPHGQCCSALPPAPVYYVLGRVRVCELGRGDQRGGGLLCKPEWTGLSQKRPGRSVPTVPQLDNSGLLCWALNFQCSIAVFKVFNFQHNPFHSCDFSSSYLELRSFISTSSQSWLGIFLDAFVEVPLNGFK